MPLLIQKLLSIKCSPSENMRPLCHLQRFFLKDNALVILVMVLTV